MIYQWNEGPWTLNWSEDRNTPTVTQSAPDPTHWGFTTKFSEKIFFSSLILVSKKKLLQISILGNFFPKKNYKKITEKNIAEFGIPSLTHKLVMCTPLQPSDSSSEYGNVPGIKRRQKSPWIPRAPYLPRWLRHCYVALYISPAGDIRPPEHGRINFNDDNEALFSLKDNPLLARRTPSP